MDKKISSKKVERRRYELEQQIQKNQGQKHLEVLEAITDRLAMKQYASAADMASKHHMGAVIPKEYLTKEFADRVVAGASQEGSLYMALRIYEKLDDTKGIENANRVLWRIQARATIDDITQ